MAGAASLVIVLGLASCSSGTAETGPSQTVAVEIGEAPSQDVVEAADGGVESALQHLPGIVDAAMSSTGVPGVAVAVVHDGDVVFSQGFGVKKAGEPGEVDPSTVFQIASVSKPISATVIAAEVSKGTVDWDTPVATLMPEFTLSDPYVTAHATVGDYFSHRTGLPKAAGDLLEDIGYDRADVLSRLSQLPLDPFRISYAYANFGLTAGAEAVAEAAGMPWEDLSAQNLFTPLGMDSTSARYADYVAREDKAALHTKIGDKFEPLLQRDADAQAPAGGVSSNVEDLAKWMNLVLGEGTVDGDELIDSAALLPATRAEVNSAPAHSAADRSGFYGYGFNAGVQPGGRTQLSHSGAFVTGAATAVTMNPSMDLGIVVLTNAAPVGVAEAIATEFMDVAQFGHATRDWLPALTQVFAPYAEPAGDLVGEAPPAAPAPAPALDTLTGTYANAYYGDAIVEQAGGTLTVKLGPGGGYVLPLTHWDGETFSFTPTGENAPDGSLSSAAFAPTPDGTTSMTLEFFNADGFGVWTR